MTRRILEIVFSHKLALVLPIVAGLALGVFLMLTTYQEAYVTTAALWVDEPTESALIDYNPYLSPAENQSRQMRELLVTKSFSTAVIERAAQNNPDVLGLPATVDQLRNSAFLYVLGPHTLIVSARSNAPQIGPAVINAIVDQYTSILSAQVEERSRRLTELYGSQLDIATVEFQAANRALSAYVASRPQLSSQTLSAASQLDPELTRLITAEQSARDNYERLLGRYTDSQRASSQGSAGYLNFSVVDKPEAPLAPERRSKRSMVVLPMAGLIAGGFVSALLLLIFWRLDRTIRSVSDLELLGFTIPAMAVPATRLRRKQWPSFAVGLSLGLESGIKNGATPPSAVPEPGALVAGGRRRRGDIGEPVASPSADFENASAASDTEPATVGSEARREDDR